MNTVLIITDEGNKAMGIPPISWEVPVPFDFDDVEDEVITSFVDEIVGVYQRFSVGNVYSEDHKSASDKTVEVTSGDNSYNVRISGVDITMLGWYNVDNLVKILRANGFTEK